ncbi:MAG: 2-succinyl-5-enolpyruvyl-6-hydroxy-3-cyclohexene-1-carboxylic-acid synthase, partial [Anaerolineae bacterium]|nr:2-succinyl-5-enolpyruvyl-6-hydroxy-3-cyclohexene-1-carboxylic-acid synthase [Anaerolineae bacterium]
MFVEELARAGLKAVCIAPGSRSTPLTLAFARHGGIKIYTHLDERSAGFFALGLALASDEPVALVCTSGTAAANFFPAIVEAHMSRVPLLVLTTDRPPELRHSGANQTIDQVKMYGDFVLWSVDAALPEANPPAIAIRNLRTLAARAYAKANGIRKGVVHINLPFRKPLEPTAVEGDMTEIPKKIGEGDSPDSGIYSAHSRIHSSETHLADSEIGVWLPELIQDNHRGVIICGGGLSPVEVDGIHVVAYASGYPVLAEPYSHVRHFHQGYGAYEYYAMYAPKPDVILRFGNVPVSKALNDFIVSSHPRVLIHIAPDGEWSDDSHTVTDVFPVSPMYVAQLLSFMDRRETKYLSQYGLLESTTWSIVDGAIKTGSYFDGAAVYDVVDLIPADSTLFAGNSLPVRLLDQFGKPQSKRIY